jgi:GNAT superfamily N-acetyltransferase
MNDCMTTQPPSIRAAMSGELDVINRVIESAVLTWDLPERVKRLSLPGLYYHETDLDFFDISVATDKKGEIVGVAALENTPLRSGPDDKVALFLHGLYVAPTSRQLGIGRPTGQCHCRDAWREMRRWSAGQGAERCPWFFRGHGIQAARDRRPCARLRATLLEGDR